MVYYAISKWKSFFKEIIMATAEKKKCSDWPLLTAEEQRQHLERNPNWELKAGEDGVPKLYRNIKCKNFMEAIDILNAAAALAENRGHHPGRNAR
jgi:pterin-4a-carbinolamine dehydratase